MKRYGNLYADIYDIENLKEAHRNARKGKSHYHEVQMVDSDPDYYLKQVHTMLKRKTYIVSKYSTFVKIDKGKERIIYRLPYYPDRIIQWAILLQIEHIFMSTLIYDTYASLPGKGIHRCLSRLHKAIKNHDETKYCLKFDIKKFFPTVDQEILKTLLRRKFKDPELLWLLDSIVNSCNQGLPIGNYLSQYFANFYLAYFDHWLKEEKGCKYYYRYMDDVVILSSDKKFLHTLKNDIDKYLNRNLNLILKENYQVYPTHKQGIDFVGYRSFGRYTLLRKATVKSIKAKMFQLAKKAKIDDSDIGSFASYSGWVKWGNCYNLFVSTLLGVKRRLINESCKRKRSA